MKTLFSMLLLALLFSISLNTFAEEIRISDGISCVGITDPGMIIIPEPVFSDPPGFVREAVDTPLSPISGISEHVGMDELRRSTINERTRASAAVKHPPVLYLSLGVPPAAIRAERVIIEFALPYDLSLIHI